MKQTTLFSFEEEYDTIDSIAKKMDFNIETPGWPDKFGQKLRKWTQENTKDKIRTLSLFSGAGGLDIGFNDAGFEIVESVEVEKEFCKTLEINSGSSKTFPEAKVNCIDIRKFTGDNLGKIDFIIGGPPCQTFSAAGRRASGVLGTTDERGTLFEEYVRLLKKLSPKGFLFENVYGIIGARGGEDWKGIQKAFSDVGYHLYFRILDAADYGVPQHRERLIIIGLKEGKFSFPRPTHGPDSIEGREFYNASTAIRGVKSNENIVENQLGGKYGYLLNDIPPGLNYSFYTEEMGHPNPIFAWRSKFSDFLYKADPMTPTRTIKASGGAYTGPLHWENRFFFYEEYKRLQTFPDDYEISGSKKIAVKQIGNSVPPQLARMLAIAVREQVFGTSFPLKLSTLDRNETLNFRKRKRQLTRIYKEKARAAIESLDKSIVIKPESRSYYASINNVFDFKECEEEEALFHIEVIWEDKLIFIITEVKKKNSEKIIEIEVSSEKVGWNKNIGGIVLDIRSSDPMAYTVAWKAFEAELIKNSIKADLVQLNGYYQYRPKLSFDVKLHSKSKLLNIIQSVLVGEYTSKNITTDVLAEAWNIRKDEVRKYAELLKEIGYEIRNSNTNPQIKQDEWLIPYSFPTLTPLSVQLWKKL